MWKYYAETGSYGEVLGGLSVGGLALGQSDQARPGDSLGNEVETTLRTPARHSSRAIVEAAAMSLPGVTPAKRAARRASSGALRRPARSARAKAAGVMV